jgi:hypothetical protein
LVNPKWKGKYVSQDPLSTGLGASLQFYYYHPELGADYIKKLFGDMQPVFGRDRRQITDWLAQGRYALCVGCRDTTGQKTRDCPSMSWITWIGKKACSLHPAVGR